MGKGSGDKNTSGVNDFYWSEKMEPHALRKKNLLKAHGKDINKLMGPDPNTKFICFGVVAAHILVGAWAIKLSWIPFLLVTYALGASFAHNLFLAIHEVTHYLAFKSKFHNDLLAMFCNIPIVIPYAMFFKEYHYEHHRYQGWDGIDQDIPMAIEAALLNSTPGKLFFLLFQGFFYALRPMVGRPLPFRSIHALNWAFVLTGDFLLYKAFGPQIFLYLLLSLVLGTGINPFAGHFISEHYLLEEQKPEAQETFSYYGPLNFFSWNVGFHNEHHDFPNVPGSRLHKLTKLAPEFYNPLKTTKSWFGAQMKFLLDPRVSEWCRMKREKGAGLRKGELLPTTPDAKAGEACFSN